MILVGLWVLLAVGGAVAFAFTEPTDMGFTRGLNRTVLLAKWEGAALVVAVLLRLRAATAETPRRAWWFRLPLRVSAVALGLGLLVVGVAVTRATT